MGIVASRKTFPRVSREFPTILTQRSSGLKMTRSTSLRAPTTGSSTHGRTLRWQTLTHVRCPTGTGFQTASTPPYATATTTRTSSRTETTTGSTKAHSRLTQTDRPIHDHPLLGGSDARQHQRSKQRGRKRKMSDMFWIEPVSFLHPIKNTYH